MATFLGSGCSVFATDQYGPCSDGVVFGEKPCGFQDFDQDMVAAVAAMEYQVGLQVWEVLEA